MNTELKKNAEGYADPTAAATLSRKEPGDIWTYDRGLCLILKNHGTFSTILLLSDKSFDPQDVRVETKDGTRYTDPRRITYGIHRKMFSFEESISTGDFNRVMLAIQDALGLELKGTTAENCLSALDDIEAQVQEIQTDRTKLLKENEFLRCQLAEMTELHAKAVERVNKVSFAKLKVENQLELLQSMVGSVLARFQVDTEEG